jgi:hypothetical protein
MVAKGGKYLNGGKMVARGSKWWQMPPKGGTLVTLIRVIIAFFTHSDRP